MKPETTDVVVLGAGPTGLTAATLLARSGTSVAVVDPFRLPAQHPRATHIDDETMRTFQTLGAAHLEPAWHRQATGDYQFFNAFGQLVQSFAWRTQPTEQGWFGDYQFFQPDLENFLRGNLHTLGVATSWYGWRALSLSQTDAGVQVSIRNDRQDIEHTLTTRYVIGADGARSMLRTLVSPDVEDLNATHRSLILDIVPTARTENPAIFTYTRAVAPNPITVVPGAGGMVRFEFLLNDRDCTADFEEPTRWYDLLQPYYEAGSYRILRADVYRWESLLPRRWRDRRLFLAGDAAHQMTPHLGQGMCSGIRDAMNLSWKITARLRGAPDSLLDTYECERKPHVRVYAEAAAAAANAVEQLAEQPGDLNDIPSLIEAPFPAPTLGAGLHGDTRGVAGVLSIQPRLPNGRRLDDVVGYRFAVVGDRSVVNGVEESTRRSWERLGAVAITDLDLTIRRWLNHHNVHAVIVRPDRYVFGGAADSPQLDHLSSRLHDLIGPGPEAGVALASAVAQ
jgi:3-(3-hydroxy-phenyl)propionate hydroxylase